jgi:hypothetical protein
MHSRTPLLALAALAAAALQTATPAFAVTKKINDTALTQCRSAGGLWSSACTGTGQDGAYGRDVSFDDDTNGAAGFDFIKICNSGQKAGIGTCPADPLLGSGHDDWACTQDKITGLVWEMKTTSGLRDGSRVYDYPTSGQDSYTTWGPVQDYVSSINTAALCGKTDWRLPKVRELQSIVHYGALFPAIDGSFFPNTGFDAGDAYWSASTVPDSSTYVWVVRFDRGHAYDDIRDPTTIHHVRLVRTTN